MRPFGACKESLCVGDFMLAMEGGRKFKEGKGMKFAFESIYSAIALSYFSETLLGNQKRPRHAFINTIAAEASRTQESHQEDSKYFVNMASKYIALLVFTLSYHTVIL